MDSGFTAARHGKRKVDQETQSPLLKIFKDVMLKEVSDQEKIGLLSDRQDEHKRSQYSTQCNTTLMAIPSTRREPTVHAQKKDSRKLKGKKSGKLDHDPGRPFARQFDAFCAGGKNKDTKAKFCKDPKCSADDTFSCHSCAFKKILCKDYRLPCKGRAPGYAIALLVLALLAYLASSGCSASHCYSLERWLNFKDPNEVQEESKSLESPEPVGPADEGSKGTNGVRNVEVGLVGRLKDVVGYEGYKDAVDSRAYADSSMQNDLNMVNYKYGSAPGSLSGMPYLNNFEGNLRAPENKELDQLLRNSNDFQNNENLQNFYKKLLATDAQIQKLKMSQTNLYNQGTDGPRYEEYYPRYKRSLWRFRRPFALFHHRKTRVGGRRLDTAGKLNASVVKTEVPTTIGEKGKEVNRKRRKVATFGTLHQVRLLSDDPSNILIQKKNIMVRFSPDENDRRSKCTHVTSDTKSHEKKLKHPFYKNSQRLDELLDQLLDKNLNNILSDPMQKDPFNKHDHLKQNKDTEGSKTEGLEVVTPKPSRLASTNSFPRTGRFFKNPFKFHDKKKKQKGESSIPLLLDEFISNGGMVREDTTTTSTEHTTRVADDPVEESSKDSTEYRKHPNPNRNHAVVIAPSHPESPLKLHQSSWPYLATPSHTRLMQHVSKEPRSPSSSLRHLLQADDAYESSLHYTDGKEVLSDDLEPHDDAEKGDTTFGKRSAKEEGMTDNSSGQILTNRNWKGPMPLYSDEIRDLISAPPRSEEQKGKKTRKLRSSAKIEDYDIRDAEAQAYSDYGVLEDKKTSQTSSSTELIVVPSKYSFKRDNYVAANAMSVEPKEAHAKASSSDWQRSRTNLLSEWGDHLGKLMRIIPDEQKDNGNLQESTELRTASKKEKASGARKSKFLKTRSLLGIAGPRRFIGDNEDDGDDDDDDDDNDANQENSPVKIASFKIIRKRAADAPRFELVDKTKNFNESDQFLSVLSQWFGNMANVANGSDCGRNKRPEQSTKSSEYSQVTHFEYPRSYNPPPHPYPYPHPWRRSLLSINEDIVNDDKVEDTVATKEKVVNSTGVMFEDSSSRNLNKSLVVGGADDAERSTEPSSNNQTTMHKVASHAAGVILNTTEVAEAKRDNKTVVKRNAPLDDKGLTFWNDLYDDEYGVQVDSLNGPEGTAKPSDHLGDSKRPRNWLKQKYRNLKNIVHGGIGDQNGQGTLRSIRDTSVTWGGAEPQTLHPSLVSTDSTETPEVLITHTEEQEPVSFKQLTVKMKDVVGQAAKAVQETNTAKAPSLPAFDREVNDTEADVGNSLMRQLMRMMSDVMDYQVHARTCLQPPEDLRVFLVQLTAPDPGRHLRDVETEYEGYRSGDGYDNIGDDEMSSNPMDLHLSQAREHDKSQSECLDALKAVQGLMTEYDMLSDEEKKRMMGVKDYLQKQADFLRSQCSAYSEYSFDLAPYYQDIMPVQRVKRHAIFGSGMRKRAGKRRFLKLWSKADDTDVLSDDTSDIKHKESNKNSNEAKEKLKEAQRALEIGIKQFSELNLDASNVKAASKTLDELRKNLVDAEKNYHKHPKEPALPEPMEDLDPAFQVAIQDSAFQEAHKINVIRFNEARRRYDKSLREGQAAKERFEKSASLYNLHREEFEKSVKQIELAKKLYKDSADNLRKMYDEFLRPKKRNLYDVYYRAVSEAKKVASSSGSSKNAYRHTTNAVKL